jgi:hypothetical protein
MISETVGILVYNLMRDETVARIFSTEEAGREFIVPVDQAGPDVRMMQAPV